MSTELSVVSYNIHSGIGIDGRHSLQRVADVLERLNADVISLQEVQLELAEETGFKDQPAKLQSMLDHDGAYGPTVTLTEDDVDEVEEDLGVADSSVAREFGNLILVDGTLKSVEYDTLTSPAEGGQRGYITAVVECAGIELRIVNTHLGLGREIRERQLDELFESLGTLERPTILAGDFNARPSWPAIDRLTERFVDAFAEDGNNRFTFPTPYVDRKPQEYYERTYTPHRRIDYVFCTSEMSVDSTEVYHSLASDHSPILARLSVPGDR